MVDRVTPDRRSWNMSRIRGKDTSPEVAVRSLLHQLGYRFRLHRKDLPGTPDVVFPGRRRVLMIHGCFWHRHPGCRYAYVPKSRTEFWLNKFKRNVARDKAAQRQLREKGWEVMVIWECELRDLNVLTDRLVEFLGPPRTGRACARNFS